MADLKDKITKPCKPNDRECILTEGINYFTTGDTSIWGRGDKDTLELLEKEEIHGKWLNLAAGDGRYNLILLKKADFVVVSDIDESALSKLWHIIPKEFRSKFKTKVFDITKSFPFEDDSFDGVFCTGTLHLFPKTVFKRISEEINRVLKTKGKLIIDFATDIKRVSSKGDFVKFKNEPKYTLEEAKGLLRDTFKNYKIRISESEVPEEEYPNNDPPYKFSSKFILLVAEKK